MSQEQNTQEQDTQETMYDISVAASLAITDKKTKQTGTRFTLPEGGVMLQEFLPNLACPLGGSGKLEEYYGKAAQNLVA